MIRRLLLLACLALAWPGLAGAQVARVSSVENSAETVASITITSVDASGANYITCGVSWRDNATQTISSVTHNGSGLTAISSKLPAEVGSVAVQVWRLIAPSGTGDVVVTMSASTPVLAVGCSLFSGVHATVPEGTLVTSTSPGATTTNTSTGVATGDANGMYFDVIGTRGETALGVGATQTRRSTGGVASGSIAAGTSTAPGASSDTLDWTFTGVRYAHIVVPILPAAGGGGSTAQPRLLPLGVGGAQ